MSSYHTHNAATLSGLTEHRVRAYARAGFIGTRKAPAGRYRFSFQDVVLLRAARELEKAGVPARRIWSGLRELRRRLPKDQSLARLRISAEGGRLTVRDAQAIWHPESGQIQFDFSVGELADAATPLVEARSREIGQDAEPSSDDWFDLGLDLETMGEKERARLAYEQALTLDPANYDAHVNLGRSLQDAGHLEQALSHYRAGLQASPDNATAAYNLGTALQDLGREREAIKIYLAALSLDPLLADAHFNIAHLYESAGRRRAALRHLARYKALMA